MEIESEIAHFDSQSALLSSFIDTLAALPLHSVGQNELFLAEAVMFRMFRIYERFTRSVFLFHCVSGQTITGKTVKSKLICPDSNTAESILKAGNKFLDWGNADTVKNLANLIFENGYPVGDLISPIYSCLIDLQRFRNFVSHDSEDAARGFKKSRGQYVKVGDELPETVGHLGLYRRSVRADIVLRLIHAKVSGLSSILRAI